jgi:hypothetical protein
MNTILDLDLDVFSSPTVYWPPKKNYRPSDNEHMCASGDDVRYFLEEQCGLSRDRRIPGDEFTHHDEAFYTWRRWIEQGSLTAPFAVAHIDAHADMGMGDAGYMYLLSELLALPVEQRGNPRRAYDALNAGNYLMFAVANRWINRLTYVFPTRHPWTANWASSPSKNFRQDPCSDGAPGDLMVMHFQNEDWRTGMLELKHCSYETLKRCVGCTGPLGPVIHTEPAVPFDFAAVPNFSFRGFTHMVVAHSPQYTPPSADQLLPILREYVTAC